MSDCCISNPKKINTQTCPQCSTICKRVEMLTLYYQIRFPENLNIVSDDYYFCSAKDCATAYFSMAGNRISKQQLTSYQAILNDKLCYCFDINTTDYLMALNTKQAEGIKNFVIERTKSGECACELKNPSGQCCLAKFKLLEKI